MPDITFLPSIRRELFLQIRIGEFFKKKRARQESNLRPSA